MENIRLISMAEAGMTEDIVEDGNAYEENALIKLKHRARRLTKQKQKNLEILKIYSCQKTDLQRLDMILRRSLQRQMKRQ